MQNPLQKLLAFDISALSLPDEFSNVMKLLSQVDNPEFVKQIEQKLKDNLAFREFQKERERENSSRLAEAGSGRLAELVAQKRQAAQRSERVQAVQNNLIFANYQLISAAFSELLATQGVAAFVAAASQQFEQIQAQFEQNPKAATQAFVNTATAVVETQIQHGKPLSDKQTAELAATMSSAAHTAEQSPHLSPQEKERIDAARIYAEIASYDPNLAKSLLKWEKGKLVRDENGLPQWKKPPTSEQALLLNELLAQKYDPNTPIGKAYLAEMQHKHPHNYQEIMESSREKENQFLAKNAIFNLAQFYQSSMNGVKNGKPFKIEQRLFNGILSQAISRTLNESSEGLESLKMQLKAIKQGGGDESRFSPLQSQFEQFGLYYANAQRIMKEKGMSFEQFLMSKDGDQFGLARQLLNTDFIKLIAKQERNVALDLLKELGADETQALVVLKAYTEVADKPQVFQHLDKKARKDYGGMGKQAEYEISADGISQKLDRHQQKSLNALQADNPDWRKDVESLVKADYVEEDERKVIENRFEISKLDFDESFIATTKEKAEKFLVETTATFQNRQQVGNTETATFKHSI